MMHQPTPREESCSPPSRRPGDRIPRRKSLSPASPVGDLPVSLHRVWLKRSYILSGDATIPKIADHHQPRKSWNDVSLDIPAQRAAGRQ